MTKYKVTQIISYPVKSLPGILLGESTVEQRGLKYDRRWMLIDKNNTFITQRLFPEMIYINIKIENDRLVFSHVTKKISKLSISLTSFPKEEITVKIWDDFCLAKKYNTKISNWFSEALNTNCSLVYMPDSTERKTSRKYFNESKNVSFADGYPFLIVGEESVNLLNNKLKKVVPISNFRPNIVFSGGKAHDEDKWKNIIIGDINFTVVKPCARCVITTIDSNANKNKEPLATLNSYRNVNNKILFGQNAVAHNTGKIKLGDSIIT